MTKLLKSFVDGQTATPKVVRTIPVINPATAQPIARLELADEALVDHAVSAARRAAAPWRALRATERSAYLYALADALEDNAETLARLESADTGMTLKMTLEGHLPRAVAHLRWYAAEAERMTGECVRGEAGFLHLVERVPLGVIAIITPWNAPLAVASLSLAAALAAGNTCVIKASEQAPLTLSVLAEIIRQLGLPNGVCNIVQGDAAAGRALVAHDGVNGICFVGGVETGRDVYARAAEHNKRLILELGGKSPTIVLADADLERAVDGALLAVFASNGEVCTAGSRIIVEQAIYADFIDAFIERTRRIRVGPPEDPQTEIGPLISDKHRLHVERAIANACMDQGVLACGGKRPSDLGEGFYLQPAVVTRVEPSMQLAQNEVFGPVAAILKASDAQHAMGIAQRTRYGLAATLWSRDISRALRLAHDLDAGTIAINSPVIRDLRAPFGGMKASGLGRVGGRAGLEQLTELRTTVVPLQGLDLPRFGTEAN